MEIKELPRHVTFHGRIGTLHDEFPTPSLQGCASVTLACNSFHLALGALWMRMAFIFRRCFGCLPQHLCRRRKIGDCLMTRMRTSLWHAPALLHRSSSSPACKRTKMNSFKAFAIWSKATEAMRDWRCAFGLQTASMFGAFDL